MCTSWSLAIKVRSPAPNLLSSLICLPPLPITLSPAHHASPVSCAAVTVHLHAFVTLHGMFPHLGYLPKKVSPASSFLSFKPQLRLRCQHKFFCSLHGQYLNLPILTFVVLTSLIFIPIAFLQF